MNPLARKDEVVIRHGGNIVVMRPTLRAAITLERLHEGWHGLLSRLGQLHLQTVQALIRASAVSSHHAEALLASFENARLATIKDAVAEPLAELLNLFLAPMHDEAEGGTKPTTASKPKPWSEAYAELYRYGTGWLGWTPAETWAATPTEIAWALEGKMAMLIAMNGGTSGEPDHATEYTPERLQEIEELGHDPAFDRTGLQRLKVKM